jgi:hypothetical protein
VQRLAYFPVLSEVPPPIVEFLAKSINGRGATRGGLAAEEKTQARRRFVDVIRTSLNIKPITEETDLAIDTAAMEAAQTKQDLADIINVVIEELVRQRFELPAFSRLNRSAQRVRNKVNEAYFKTLTTLLAPAVIAQFDAMLAVSAGQVTSGWQQLKQDPKKPTNNEVRQYLEHVQWLKSWSTELPAVDHIPAVKRTQYVHEARALDAACESATDFPTCQR